MSDDHVACIRLLAAGDHPEQRRLARAVRSDDADDRAGWNLERQIVDQQPVAVSLADVPELDDLVAEPFGDRDEDFLGFIAFLVLVRRQLLEAGDARLALRLPALRVRAHPLELFLHCLDARRLLLRLALEPLFLLLEPRRVIALPRNAVA